jgi:uncharacterized 2Fe-2S/4Fe-4S cluster protein (DUF4445 family)
VSTASVSLTTPEGPRTLTAAAAETSLTLAEWLARRGLPLNTRCGGRGLCAGCEVVVTGRPASEIGGQVTCGGGRGPEGGERVKACRVTVADVAGAAVAVPARSLLRHEPAVVSEFRIGIPWARDPLAVNARYGAAVDVGTTTVALALCDLAAGQVIAEASAFNAQIRHGEDVLTRIQFCATGPAAVAELQRALARETLQPLLERAAADAGVALLEIAVLTVAGNTTMQHLLAGVDPTPMGTHPFRAVFLEHRTYAPAALGLDFGGADAVVHLLPGPAAYVGADLAAGMVATGMLYDEGPTLLVDVGTNGEIVAKVGDRLIGCATAAGPAFEGAGLTSGVRGVTGAIERVRLRVEPFAAECDVIGAGPRPIGLCGSAYVDFLWEARRAGVIGPNGRFTAAFAATAGDALAADEYGRKLRLHAHGAAGPVWISEVDIARLLQAKAAIAAGITTLLGLLGTTAAQVKRVHLAGGFGLHLSLEHAIGCGLLPGFAPAQIAVVGNTSLGGAFLALNDRSLLAEMQTACGRMESVELNLQPGFEDAYIDHLSL